MLPTLQPSLSYSTTRLNSGRSKHLVSTFFSCFYSFDSWPLKALIVLTVGVFQGWELAHWFFKRIARFLWTKELKSDSLGKKSELLPSLFCHEWCEWIAHGRFFVKSNWRDWAKSDRSDLSWHKKGGFTHGHSFVMGDLSESLTVALLLRGTRAIGSRSLFLKSEVSESFTVAQ